MIASVVDACNRLIEERGLHVVSAQLGHASTSFTADVYAHVSEAASSEAAAKVAGILGAGDAG